MVKFTAAKCPSCKADLDLKDDTKRYTCPYCGTVILIDNDVKKETQEVKENKKEEKSKRDIIGEAKKYINQKKYNDAKRVLHQIMDKDSSDIESRILFALACCKEIESDPIYKDTTVEMGSIALLDLITVIDKLKQIDKDKTYLKELSEYKNNFDDYGRIYDAKVEYKITYDKANRKLGELYTLASNKLNASKANGLIKEYFDLEDKKLPHLSYEELLKKSKEINNKYDEFKLEIDKCIKKDDTVVKNTKLKKLGIILVGIVVGIILFIINPWIVFVGGILAMLIGFAIIK